MFKFLLCALAALTFLGCGDEKDYGNVHYDRDVCEHCQMAISDNRFSVDVRVHISNLRSKTSNDFILSSRGLGYKINA